MAKLSVLLSRCTIGIGVFVQYIFNIDVKNIYQSKEPQIKTIKNIENRLIYNKQIISTDIGTSLQLLDDNASISSNICLMNILFIINETNNSYIMAGIKPATEKKAESLRQQGFDRVL